MLDLVSDDDKLFHRHAADEVLLDNALENLGRASPVPDAVRVNHGHWTLLANPQAVCLGAVNPALADQAKLVQAFLQIAPGLEPHSLL